MYRYALGPTLGSGSYGEVHQAVHKESGRQVAIKTLKDHYDRLEDCLKLPEVVAHKHLIHPNIVRCSEVLLHEKRAHLVFELMDSDLESFCRNRKRPLTEDELRPIFYQILAALNYMHSNGFLHRDVKPENVLLNFRTTPPTVKISDFGMAKHMALRTRRPHTSYVATRWYRAPEILFHAKMYGPSADMWSAGTVFAEIFLGRPLFPGSDEVDQIQSIIRKRGHPRMVGWEEGTKLARIRKLKLPLVTPTSLEELLPNASLALRQLIEDLLRYDPDQRPLAADAMRYPFFNTAPFCLPRGARNLHQRQEQVHRRPNVQRSKSSAEIPVQNNTSQSREGALVGLKDKIPAISLVSRESDVPALVKSSGRSSQHRVSMEPLEPSLRVRHISKEPRITLRRSTRHRTQPDRYIPGNQIFIIPKIKKRAGGVTRLRSPAASFNMRKA